MDNLQAGQMNVDYARMARLNQQAQAAASANSAKSTPATRLGVTDVSGYRNPKTDDERKMRDVANDFEAIFIKQMLDEMEKTVERDSSVFGSGETESYFRDMMHDEMSKQMSKRPGGSAFGLGESIYRQLAKQQPPDVGPTGVTMGETLKMGEAEEEKKPE